MAARKKYSLRPGAVALTKQQWVIAAIAGLLGLFGVAVAVTGDLARGGLLMGIAGLSMSLLILTNMPARGGRE